MKDIFVRLFLLNIYIYKVLSQPYRANSDGKCLNPNREYKLDGSNLCCNRCKPGHRLKQECSNNTDTKCEPCPKGQFIESWNYSPNCFPCKKCKSGSGLQYLQNCTSSIRSKCGCQPDMFCIMGFVDPYCDVCTTYTTCKAGYGVSKPGTAKSDVTCEQCPDGTFSDTVSNTDRCRPHTNCYGRVVKSGNGTADAVCQPGKFQTNILSQTSTKEPLIETEFTTLNKRMITLSESEATPRPRLAVSEVAFNQSTKSPPTRIEFGSQLGMETAATIACVIGVLFILITLLFCWKTTCMKDAVRFHHKTPVDSNGNCKIGDKINGGYLGETQVMSLTITSPEQQFLLEKGELSSDQLMTTNNTAALTRTDDCSSYESIGPLQSTTALHSINSALSEPMILLSSTESGPPQNEIHRQSSSQPTSPEIISPVTTSSHVNVNITVHIGNGSGRTPTVLPTDTVQVDSELPFGEEEESFSMPQQEAGKQSVMAVQEGSA